MNVVLPEPLGPVRPYRSPRLKTAFTFSKRVCCPKFIETSLTEIMEDLRGTRPQKGRTIPETQIIRQAGIIERLSRARDRDLK